MPRLMSVSLTESAVVARKKTVTRRMGWLNLKQGDRLTLCRKVMGRKRGEPLVRIVDVEVVSVRRERLDEITREDIDREGFPGWTTPDGFIRFFCGTHKGCQPDSMVTRIEWRYLESGGDLMGWAVGYDPNWNRDIGYGVPAKCDHPDCNADIERGLGYVCGGELYGGEWGCGLFFCSEHLIDGPQRCDRCVDGEPPFDAKPDVLEWINHKLTDESWQKWRDENPAEVIALAVLTAADQS